MAALTPLFLVLAGAWTAYGAYEESYDQDLRLGRVCMAILLLGLSLPSFLPAIALPLLFAAFAGLIGSLVFARRVYEY